MHLCLVGFVGLVVVGFDAVGFCWFGLHPVFLLAICLGPTELLLSLDYRRLEDRSSLGARTT